jgi:integrase
MASISKLTLPSGTIRYECRIKQSGRVIDKRRFKTRKAAQQYALRIEGDKDMLRALGQGGGNITFTDLAQQYLVQYDGKAHSRRSDVRWWMERLGSTSAMTVDVVRLNRELDGYEARPAPVFIGKKDGVAQFKDGADTPKPASINQKRAAVIAVLRYGMSNGYLTDNAGHKVRRRSGDNKRRRYLTTEEDARLVVAAEQSTWPQMKLFVMFGVDLGARKGEVLGLLWSDIDFNAKQVTFRDTKNGSDRTIVPSAGLLQELMRFRRPDGFVFPSKSRLDKPFDPRAPWEKLVSAVGLEDFRYHDTRHSAASFLLSEGYALAQIGELLGHKSEATTKRYAHLLPEATAEMTAVADKRRAKA